MTVAGLRIGRIGRFTDSRIADQSDRPAPARWERSLGGKPTTKVQALFCTQLVHSTPQTRVYRLFCTQLVHSTL